jgi:tRNA G18 (ribose-2'-O)-methylase SpoU
LPQFVTITDPADPRVAAYRDIKERDLVGREGRFIAEGETVLRAFVRDAPGRVESLLIDPKRRDKLSEVFDGLPEATPVYLVEQAVLDALAGFHLHRGVLAMGRKPRAIPAAELLATLPERAVVAALFGIANHDNLGGIFRNAAAFGADAVLLDADCCDPFYRKARLGGSDAERADRLDRARRGRRRPPDRGGLHAAGPDAVGGANPRRA